VNIIILKNMTKNGKKLAPLPISSLSSSVYFRVPMNLIVKLEIKTIISVDLV